jgi:hypothetical protein
VKKRNSISAVECEAKNGPAEGGLIALNSGARRQDAGKDEKYRGANKREHPRCEFA